MIKVLFLCISSFMFALQSPAQTAYLHLLNTGVVDQFRPTEFSGYSASSFSRIWQLQQGLTHNGIRLCQLKEASQIGLGFNTLGSPWLRWNQFSGHFGYHFPSNTSILGGANLTQLSSPVAELKSNHQASIEAYFECAINDIIRVTLGGSWRSSLSSPLTLIGRISGDLNNQVRFEAQHIANGNLSSLTTCRVLYTPTKALRFVAEVGCNTAHLKLKTCWITPRWELAGGLMHSERRGNFIECQFTWLWPNLS